MKEQMLESLEKLDEVLEERIKLTKMSEAVERPKLLIMLKDLVKQFNVYSEWTCEEEIKILQKTTKYSQNKYLASGASKYVEDLLQIIAEELCANLVYEKVKEGLDGVRRSYRTVQVENLTDNTSELFYKNDVNIKDTSKEEHIYEFTVQMEGVLDKNNNIFSGSTIEKMLDVLKMSKHSKLERFDEALEEQKKLILLSKMIEEPRFLTILKKLVISYNSASEIETELRYAINNGELCIDHLHYYQGYLHKAKQYLEIIAEELNIELSYGEKKYVNDDSVETDLKYKIVSFE